MHVPTARQLPSGNWACRVRRKGVDIPITKPTQREAIAEAMRVIDELEKSDRTRIKNSLRECMTKYIDARRGSISPSTISSYDVILRNRMKNLMPRPIDKITLPMIQRSMDEEARRLSPKTISNTYGLLKAVFRENGIDMDFNRLHTPRPAKAEKRIYDKDEIEKLLRALRGTEIECEVLLALMLGLRRSEICGLQWRDIDFKHGTIHVRRAMVLDEDRNPVIKETKTVGSDRLLQNCPAYLMDRLAALERSNGPVFHHLPDELSRRFRFLLRDNDLPHVGLHALRHTFASVMVSLDAPDKYIMSLGGWTAQSTMQGIYAHTMDDAMRAVTDERNKYFDALTGEKKHRRFKIVSIDKLLPDAKKKP